jgi:hypothetical protein
MLEKVDHVSQAPATVAAVLPRMRCVVEATAGTEGELGNRGVLAGLLRRAGQVQEAEALMRAVISLAFDRGEFRTASGAAGQLASLLRDSGRLDEALRVADEKAEYIPDALALALGRSP